MEEKRKQRAADAPAAAKSPKPVAKKPAAAGTRPAAAKRGAGAKKPAAAKKPVKKRAPAKKPPAGEDGLPPWLIKVVDWCIDLPDKLKPLPGRFIKLFDSWFYRVYFPLTALAVIAIVAWLGWLNGFAADYEAAQPTHVADEVAQMFVDADYDRLYALDTSAQALSGGDRAFYVESLRTLTENGKIEWNESYASGADAMSYNVTLNGSKLASFTLVPSGQKTAHGNTLWQLGTVTTHVALESPADDPSRAPCRVQAPDGYAVTVDGRLLGEADTIRSGVAVYPDGFLPKDVAAPTMTEYGFTPEGGAPVVRVTDASGAEAAVREETENVWVCGLREDAAARERYSEAIVKLAQRIAKYTTADVSQGAALSDVISGSPAESTIKAFKNDWAPSHKSERFENMAVSDFHTLSDNCFTCHVKFDYILTSRRQNDYPYPTEYTFCIVRRGEEGKLYNLMFH